MDAIIINEVAIGALEEAERRNDDPSRSFLAKDNPFETLSNWNFQRTFRLSKNLVRNLIETVEPFMEAATRGSALDILTKVVL